MGSAGPQIGCAIIAFGCIKKASLLLRGAFCLNSPLPAYSHWGHVSSGTQNYGKASGQATGRVIKPLDVGTGAQGGLCPGQRRCQHQVLNQPKKQEPLQKQKVGNWCETRRPAAAAHRGPAAPMLWQGFRTCGRTRGQLKGHLSISGFSCSSFPRGPTPGPAPRRQSRRRRRWPPRAGRRRRPWRRFAGG